MKGIETRRNGFDNVMSFLEATTAPQ